MKSYRVKHEKPNVRFFYRLIDETNWIIKDIQKQIDKNSNNIVYLEDLDENNVVDKNIEKTQQNASEGGKIKSRKYKMRKVKMSRRKNKNSKIKSKSKKYRKYM
jgi:hypothetical protein